MLALSVRQPWAWAIIFAGKDIENRVWRTNCRGSLGRTVGREVVTGMHGLTGAAKRLAFTFNEGVYR